MRPSAPLFPRRHGVTFAARWQAPRRNVAISSGKSCGGSSLPTPRLTYAASWTGSTLRKCRERRHVEPFVPLVRHALAASVSQT